MPTTGFGPTTTAAEIVANVHLHGKRAVVTGASSGIGVETARALASTGAEVTLAVRNLAAGRKVADEIAEKLPTASAGLQVAALDLADPASVAGFVRAWSGPLHILVNNAGVMALPKLTRTAAGYEMQFATNPDFSCGLAVSGGGGAGRLVGLLVAGGYGKSPGVAPVGGLS